MEQGLFIVLALVGIYTTVLVVGSIMEIREGKRRGRAHTAGHEEAA